MILGIVLTKSKSENPLALKYPAFYDMCLINNNGSPVVCDAMMRVVERYSLERAKATEAPKKLADSELSPECREKVRKAGEIARKVDEHFKDNALSDKDFQLPTADEFFPECVEREQALNRAAK
jgi:hypothetical protein